MRSMLIFDDLSFLQSRADQKERTNELTIGHTSDLLVYSTKSCVGHDGTRNEIERWLFELVEVKGSSCFYVRVLRSVHVTLPLILSVDIRHVLYAKGI
jgi:hypothetical protein